MYRETKETNPPCERCFPGVEPENVETWLIYQYIGLDSMGITISGIKILCDYFEVRRPIEALVKLRVLHHHSET